MTRLSGVTVSLKWLLFLLLVVKSSCRNEESRLTAARRQRSSYYAWFYAESASSQITDKAFKFYKVLFSNDTIAKEAMKEFKVNTKQQLMNHLTRAYAHGDPILHTTATFCATQQDCAPYQARPAVQQGTGMQDSLTVIGFLLTPRLLGARNHLTRQQWALWGSNDTEMYTNLTCCDKLQAFSNRIYGGPVKDKFTPTEGYGSRSHVTVALAKGVQAVQTGLDLIDLIKCEQECKSNKYYYEISDDVGEHSAWMRYYGHGRFLMYLQDRHPNYSATFNVAGA